MRDRILVVAKGTYLEAIRDRVLYAAVAFTVVLVLFSRVLGWLSLEDTLKVVQDVSLSGLQILALLLSMLVGAQSLAREVERRTIYTVLSRDCRREEFLVGKFLGLVGVTWTSVLGSGAFAALWIVLNGGNVNGAVVAAILGILGETLVLTAAALFLGSLASSAIAAVGVLVFYFSCHATEALRELTKDGRSPGLEWLFEGIYRVVPNLESVNFINHTTSGRPVDWIGLGLGWVQMILWSAVFLVLGGALFRRRQF